jgi:hypothetical protein
MSDQARALLAAAVTAATGISMALGLDMPHELAGLITTLVETAVAICAIIFAALGGPHEDGESSEPHDAP